MSGRPLPGTNDDLVRPPLRYRRFGGGYRREDVSRVGETIARAERGDAPPVSDTVSDTVELQPVENGFPGADLSSLRESFSTRVEVDAGPFVGFDSLADFERELGSIADVEDVYVRRVTGERAVIELTVVEGTPLLARMRESLPYRLDVRDRSRDRLVVDVDVARPLVARNAVTNDERPRCPAWSAPSPTVREFPITHLGPRP